MEKLAFTVEEAAQIMSLGVHTVGDLVRQKKLLHIRVGRRIVVPKWAIEKYLKDNANQEQAS